MAKYRIARSTYIRPSGSEYDRLFKAGDVVDFDGVPNAAMEPLDKEAEEAVALRRAEVEGSGLAIREGSARDTIAEMQKRLDELVTENAVLKQRQRSSSDAEKLAEAVNRKRGPGRPRKQPEGASTE